MDIKLLLVLIILIFASYKDIKYREVGNYISILIIIVSLINFKLINFCGLILAPLPLVLTNIRIKDAFGGADIKIMASLGLCLGTTKALTILIIALIFVNIIKKIKYIKSVPFIPYILIGYIITILV